VEEEHERADAEDEAAQDRGRQQAREAAEAEHAGHELQQADHHHHGADRAHPVVARDLRDHHRGREPGPGERRVRPPEEDASDGADRRRDDPGLGWRAGDDGDPDRERQERAREGEAVEHIHAEPLARTEARPLGPQRTNAEIEARLEHAEAIEHPNRIHEPARPAKPERSRRRWRRRDPGGADRDRHAETRTPPQRRHGEGRDGGAVRGHGSCVATGIWTPY